MSKQHQNRSRNKNFKSRNENAAPVDESNPVIIAFKQYALELDDKHDRFENIVKLSRDITIESKRIIFLLHTIDPNKNNKEKILHEARTRLDNVIASKFLPIALELGKRDPYQYVRGYWAGLQEFIEAYSFYEYLNGSELSDWNVLQEKLKFNVGEEPNMNVVACLVDPNEYILGLGDLSGEIMRRCINSLGSGDISTCQDCCKVLQNFYTGFLSLNAVRNREFGRKLYTMHQSVIKTEHVCYNIKVRGVEAACRGGMTDDKPADDFDEGFFN